MCFSDAFRISSDVAVSIVTVKMLQAKRLEPPADKCTGKN